METMVGGGRWVGGGGWGVKMSRKGLFVTFTAGHVCWLHGGSVAMQLFFL